MTSSGKFYFLFLILIRKLTYKFVYMTSSYWLGRTTSAVLLVLIIISR